MVRCPLHFKPVWETEGRSWLHDLSDPNVDHVIQESTHIYTVVNKNKKDLKNKKHNLSVNSTAKWRPSAKVPA